MEPKLKAAVGLFATNPNPEPVVDDVPEVKTVLLLGAPKVNVSLAGSPWSFWVFPKANDADGVTRLDVLLLVLEPNVNCAALEIDLDAGLF